MKARLDCIKIESIGIGQAGGWRGEVLEFRKKMAGGIDQISRYIIHRFSTCVCCT